MGFKIKSDEKQTLTILAVNFRELLGRAKQTTSEMNTNVKERKVERQPVCTSILGLWCHLNIGTKNNGSQNIQSLAAL